MYPCMMQITTYCSACGMDVTGHQIIERKVAVTVLLMLMTQSFTVMTVFTVCETGTPRVATLTPDAIANW